MIGVAASVAFTGVGIAATVVVVDGDAVVIISPTEATISGIVVVIGSS